MMGVRQQVMERDNNRCIICGSTENLELGHYIAKFNGGHACLDNLQVECRSCNRHNDHNDRTNSNVTGCRGCGKPQYRKGKRNDNRTTMGFFFQCLMCRTYRFREKAMKRTIERKDNHFERCDSKVRGRANTGYIRELDYDDWQQKVKSWMISK